MLPHTAIDGTVKITEMPSRTYRMDIKNDRIMGKVDGLESIKQAVYKAIHTERYDYLIYSWNYGIELKDLFGREMDYCITEIERRLTEALEQDDRIESVTDFEFEVDKRVLTVSFTVNSSVGSFNSTELFEL